MAFKTSVIITVVIILIAFLGGIIAGRYSRSSEVREIIKLNEIASSRIIELEKSNRDRLDKLDELQKTIDSYNQLFEISQSKKLSSIDKIISYNNQAKEIIKSIRNK